MNISKQKIEKMRELETKIRQMKEEKSKINKSFRDEAEKLLKEIALYEDIEHLDILRFSRLDEDEIYYEAEIYDGRDYNNQDIYNLVEFELPTEILYDSNAKDEYIKSLKKEKENEECIKEQKEEAIRLKKLSDDKDKYEELKIRFENN